MSESLHDHKKVTLRFRRCLRGLILLATLWNGQAFGGDDRVAASRSDVPAASAPLEKAAKPGPVSLSLPSMSRQELLKSAQTVILFGLVSLVPVAVLMLTAFVRINIVLILLRQALGSPQIPGNQVLTALALLLTALVMRPTGESIYQNAVAPYVAGEITEKAAWVAGSQPIKNFMITEIWKSNHQHYVQALLEYDTRTGSAVAPASLEEASRTPLRVIAPAFLLSELTQALLIGFYLYLPFLVIDLVVAAVLAASGLFMLPPSLISTPLKLLLFVLADGWFLVAEMILRSYGVVTPSQ